ncbi:Coiled-coil domain-containing protein 86-like Protein [Tribolium castaneum]|uniref:Coiled-coil domain-containing protein 86 n=1 Tax=Tribolium castaneum TaxID=7070 RepID=D6WSN0_TRICA|nr:PREDICTED: coiled-coil domain-containing protein 86 [Tribolium castaneum]EFA05893.1 Coiled-coil domain-containing protein 86-like Protein [Tribolium castaneum]|eukprot:XP_970528.1 PREDICTED: coiled-coil domain-containing protein 86 [Tribolium castaneum]
MTKINTNASSVQKTSASSKNKSKEPDVIRGKPKSGRFWKNEKKKFSSIIKTRGIRSSFEKKQVLRQELKRIKDASRAIKAAKDEEKEQKKQRRRENLKRQEENRKKSEIVQVITNTSKIKKMKKKQLRYIEKRDTVKM